jgi:hypothetical protein
MMIYTGRSSKKTRKQIAKQEAAWNEQQKKYGVKTESKKFVPMSAIQPKTPIRSGAEVFKSIQSIKSVAVDTFQRQAQMYTGTAMIGIATMHKSNSVPVFSTKDAKDIAKMRRD